MIPELEHGLPAKLHLFPPLWPPLPPGCSEQQHQSEPRMLAAPTPLASLVLHGLSSPRGDAPQNQSPSEKEGRSRCTPSGAPGEDQACSCEGRRLSCGCQPQQGSWPMARWERAPRSNSHGPWREGSGRGPGHLGHRTLGYPLPARKTRVPTVSPPGISRLQVL